MILPLKISYFTPWYLCLGLCCYLSWLSSYSIVILGLGIMLEGTALEGTTKFSNPCLTGLVTVWQTTSYNP